jgi:hypothetical protein
MRNCLPRAGAACAAVVLGLAVATPAVAQDPLQGAAALQQRLDLSAIAASRAAQPVEARLTPAQAATLKGLGRDFGRTGNQSALLRGWQRYLVGNRPDAVDVGALVALVMREAYLQSSADLKQNAEKVKAANQQKKLRAAVPGPTAPTVRMLPGAAQMQIQPTGDSDQLANIDLQNSMQKQQQTLNTASAVAKAMNDTAMAVVRGMK